MRTQIIGLLTIGLLIAGPSMADDQQTQLDAACEAAREKKLVPLRAKLINECVENEGKDRAYCEQFYADWDGNRGGGLSRRFYDLPECEAAFDYRRSSGRHR